MNKITLIGDVHGHFKDLKLLIEQTNNTVIQIGDLGIGFYKKYDEYFDNNIDSNKKFHFIRGNHDNPLKCKRKKSYLGDYGLFLNKIFFVSGAYSIDKFCRTENIDWWRDEELSYRDCEKAVNLYNSIKPNIVITHSSPFSILYAMNLTKKINTSTNQLFQIMLDSHKPKYWYFGHFHMSLDATIEGCKFMCLNCLETKEIEI